EPARLALSAGGMPPDVDELFDRERARRSSDPSEAYLVGRFESTRAPAPPGGAAAPSGGAQSRSIVAGYPWFGVWGRDTFIALRGLCLATGRRELAHAILRHWAELEVDGLMPNRFD